MSVLAAESDACLIMEEVGLEIDQWLKRTRESALFFQKMVTKIEARGFPPVGTHLLMGDNARVKLQNCLDNLQEDRVSVVLGLAQKRQ